MTVLERLRLYSFGGRAPRYLALYSDTYVEESDGIDKEQYHLAGGLNPTLFKTLRNARRAAGERGFVVVFEPHLLRVADADDIVDGRNDELQFAERQMLLWTERVQHLMRGAR